MLTKKILSSTVALALTASVAMLSGCPQPPGTPTTSASPDASASASADPSASASASASAPAASASAPAASASAPAGSASPAASAAPTATGSTAPSSQTGGTSDIKERATFNGTVYDVDGTVLDGAKVSAKSIDSGVTWVGQEQDTANGAYVFQNAPVGTRVEITAIKAGFTTRTQTVVLKSNLTGDPSANTYDFGGTAGNFGQFALQDEPEVVNLKVNGTTPTAAGSQGILNGTIYTPAETTAVSMSNVDNSKFEVEMNFSEPVDKESVQSNLRVYSEVTAGALTKVRGSGAASVANSFLIDDGYGTFSWSNDDKSVTYKTTKPLLTLNSGTALRYKLTFASPFKDKSGKQARRVTTANPGTDSTWTDKAGGYFKYSASVKADYLTFSLANDDSDFILESASATDNINGEYDRVVLNFNKSLDVNVKRSVPSTNNTFASSLKTSGAAASGKLELMYDHDGDGTQDVVLCTIERFVDGTITNFKVAPGPIRFETANSGKSLVLKTNNGTDIFNQNDRLFVAIDKLRSPAGKEISTDNSTDSSIGGGKIISTNNSKKVGAAS